MRGGGGDGVQVGRKKEERKRVDFTASTKARYEEGRVGAGSGGGNGKGLGGLADQEAEGEELEGLAREVDEEDMQAEGMEIDISSQPTALTSTFQAEPEEVEDEDEVDADAQANKITYPALSSPAPTAPPSTASMPPSPSP